MLQYCHPTKACDTLKESRHQHVLDWNLCNSSTQHAGLVALLAALGVERPYDACMRHMTEEYFSNHLVSSMTKHQSTLTQSADAATASIHAGAAAAVLLQLAANRPCCSILGTVSDHENQFELGTRSTLSLSNTELKHTARWKSYRHACCWACQAVPADTPAILC
jgi:hypothetical protein